MKEWGIKNKIFTISVDNASNNDLAIKLLKETFLKSKRLLLGGALFHVRCAAHILNLIVQDGLHKFEYIIEDVKESVRYINASEARLKKFAEILQQMQIRVRKLIIDCPTCWNSTYDILVAAMKVKDAFPIFAQREVRFLNCPTPDDWIKVEKVLKILEVFYEATHIISGSEYPTSNKFLAVIWRVKEVLNEGAIASDDFIQETVTPMKEKFDKYWGECNLLMAIAAVLDPRFKMKLIEFSFPLIYQREEVDANLAKVKKKLNELYCEYKAMVQSDQTSHSMTDQHPSASGSSGSLGGSSSNVSTQLSGLSRFNQFIKSAETIQPIKSELDVYLEDGVYIIDENAAAHYDALGWWKANELKYRVLSKMAIDILAIPMSTVASESTFSTSGRVLDPYHSKLSVETMQVLICGGDWV
ncbi:zinc finger BED domain-containing protein RICESLEEPER 2-like [Tripterygium wilfordii]|uniref:zinc finger BED domain-containing protein RICESLEEPER 2-like n=1 Tax=Tripterygium wilfordii TaxID=458696 RepID=UPI0018F7F68F|nr:zinc finger BED domain-containing protein RICESLEEPER 2-like [Tripterygium wilfordii]